MKTLKSPYRLLSNTLFALAACLLAGSTTSRAAQIYWADWTSQTVGDPSGGSAHATLTGLGVNVSYTGEVDGPRGDGAIATWTPTSTFSGGFVGNAPIASDGSILLGDGPGVVDTITFSTPVVNPVMALWSLGNYPGDTVSFNFQTTQPITIESGGPSQYFGSQSIVGSGSTISGTEGNGTIEFHGTFSQISWTSTLESSGGYAFTVGAASVPEPTLPCLILMGLAVWRYNRK